MFEQIWVQIRWLNSYGHINELALRKIKKKFIKNFFQDKIRCTVKQKLGEIIRSKTFVVEEGRMCDEMQILSTDLVKFYSECFCNGNIAATKK